MDKTIVTLILATAFGLTLTSCKEPASADEIDRMCERLLVLRDKAGDKAMKKECLEEAKREEVTQRQALCRISAVNKMEYWNRCRRGEARKIK